MKFKKIVGFGDSWMYGDELLDPDLVRIDPTAHPCYTQNQEYRESHCFLGLLGEHYKVPTENFGIPGGSLQSEIWTLMYWLEHEPNPAECLVLVGHTDNDRMSLWNPEHIHYANDPEWNKMVHSAWTDATDDVVSPAWKDIFKRLTVMSMCPDLGRLNYRQASMFFDGQSARYHFPLLQFDIMPKPLGVPALPTEIWRDFSMTIWFRDHPGNRQRELIKDQGHPNEMGHRMICDRLISQIDMLN